jgi:hypothetical protein
LLFKLVTGFVCKYDSSTGFFRINGLLMST